MAKKKSKLSASELKAKNDAQKQETEHKLLDKIYFLIIDRYTKVGREFDFSDVFVWKGVVYVLPETINYMIFFGLFLMLAKISFKKYGDARTIVFFMLLIMWRIQVAVKLLGKINDKL